MQKVKRAARLIALAVLPICVLGCKGGVTSNLDVRKEFLDGLISEIDKPVKCPTTSNDFLIEYPYTAEVIKDWYSQNIPDALLE